MTIGHGDTLGIGTSNQPSREMAVGHGSIFTSASHHLTVLASDVGQALPTPLRVFAAGLTQGDNTAVEVGIRV